MSSLSRVGILGGLHATLHGRPTLVMGAAGPSGTPGGEQLHQSLRATGRMGSVMTYRCIAFGDTLSAPVPRSPGNLSTA